MMHKTTKKYLFAVGLLAAALSAHAACPSWPTAERFTINGEEVTDKRAGLVWKRCTEGQTWTGSSCSGIMTGYTHQQALARAKSANNTDSATGWRLPNVKELASLADRGCQNLDTGTPTIDSTAFPNTPNITYWSSSPYVRSSDRAWAVYFGTALVSYGSRTNGHRVRLVRSSQ